MKYKKKWGTDFTIILSLCEFCDIFYCLIVPGQFKGLGEKEAKVLIYN